MKWISLICSGHSIQMQKNTPSSHMHMEHSPGSTTSSVTNQTPVNLRRLKTYQASSPTTEKRCRFQGKKLQNKKLIRKTQVLNDTLDEMDLTDVFGTLHPNAEEYTFFSSAYGTFSRIDHILGHNQTSVNLRNFKSYQASSLTTTLGD